MLIPDPLSDLFARLKNAWAVKKKRFSVPYTNQIVALLKIFETRGLIEGFICEDEANGRKVCLVTPAYRMGQAPVEQIIRVSSPGQRIYQGYRDLSGVRQGYGFRIVSTPRGVMTDEEARKRKLGGEVICEIR